MANTNVLYFGGKLLALWEAAQPCALDPKSLETIGLDTLDEQLQPGMPFTTSVPFVDKLAAGVVGDPLTAHPKVDEPSPNDAADARNGRRLVTHVRLPRHAVCGGCGSRPWRVRLGADAL